jgi:hypothetical protein
MYGSGCVLSDVVGDLGRLGFERELTVVLTASGFAFLSNAFQAL